MSGIKKLMKLNEGVWSCEANWFNIGIKAERTIIALMAPITPLTKSSAMSYFHLDII